MVVVARERKHVTERSIALTNDVHHGRRTAPLPVPPQLSTLPAPASASTLPVVTNLEAWLSRSIEHLNSRSWLGASHRLSERLERQLQVVAKAAANHTAWKGLLPSCLVSSACANAYRPTGREVEDARPFLSFAYRTQRPPCELSASLTQSHANSRWRRTTRGTSKRKWYCCWRWWSMRSSK